MTRFVVTASLVLFSNQTRCSIGLGRSSQFDAGEFGLRTLMLDSDRTVFADSEAMGLQFATLCSHATEFMQVPKATSNLVHRSDGDFGLVVGNVVANHPLEHARLRMWWAARLG